MDGLCLTLHWTTESIISFIKLIVDRITREQDDKSPTISFQGPAFRSEGSSFQIPDIRYPFSCLSRSHCVPQVGIGLIPMKDAPRMLSLCTAIFKNKLTASIPRKIRWEKNLLFFFWNILFCRFRNFAKWLWPEVLLHMSVFTKLQCVLVSLELKTRFFSFVSHR